MQSTGQYGVSDAPQYVVGRQAAPPRIFSISHDNIAIGPPAAHALHAQQQQQQQHHLAHHLQGAQQHHHYGARAGHQGHPGLQQIHQALRPQFPLPQHPSQQGQQSAQDVHQQVHQQQQAQREVQQAWEAQQQREVQQQREQQQREQQQREQQQRDQQQREQQQRELQQREQQQREQQQREQQQREQQQQLAQQQAAAQQAMVQQLGLGGPDSPEVPSPGVSRPSPTKYNYQQLVVAAQEDDGLEEEGRSTGGNRWPRQETLALIKVRSEMDANFRDSGLKGPLWEGVSRKLAEQGFQRSAKKCKEKFENVHKYYKKTKDGKAGRQDGKSYRFFSQLEALYGGQPAAVQLDHTDTAAAANLLTGSAVPGNTSGAAGDDYNGISAQRQSEVSTEVTLSESILEDDYDEPESGAPDNQETKDSKKRKRGACDSKTDFFESLMKSLVEKQEGMQRKFLEFMERREQERYQRDEVWRSQEMARVAREHELRVQEHSLAASRDRALVAFLQKVTGQTLTLPQIATQPAPMVVPPSIDSVVTPPALKLHKPSLATVTQVTPISQQLVAHTDTDPGLDSSVDPNSKRWPKPEVLTLINLRSEMEPRFSEST